MKMSLIFTNDWELFGNGAGEYFDIQDKPIRELLSVFAGEGAALTVMAEVGQQWAHQKWSKRYAWCGRVAEAWENTLQEAVANGHDVQMHFHPQWLGASWQSGRWVLDMEKCERGAMDEASWSRVLCKGKEYLEYVLRYAKAGYRCCCFRAGAFRTEPARALIEALLHNGFICDSSVVKGLYHDEYYDYRLAESPVVPWITRSDSLVCRGTGSGVLEMPVCAVRRWGGSLFNCVRRARCGGPVPTIEEEHWFKERKRVLECRYPRRERAFVVNRMTDGYVRARVRRFVNVEWRMLDYDVMSSREFVDAVDRTARKYQRKLHVSGIDRVPIVAIGHVKAIHGPEQAKRILAGLRSRFGDDCEYTTLGRAAQRWHRKLVGKSAN